MPKNENSVFLRCGEPNEPNEFHGHDHHDNYDYRDNPDNYAQDDHIHSTFN